MSNTNNHKYINSSLPKIVSELTSTQNQIELTGEGLTISQIISADKNTPQITLSENEEIYKKINESHLAMINDIQEGKPVYGSNTSYGGQAAVIHNEGEKEHRLSMAKKLSEKLEFLDVGVGSEIPIEITKAAMLIRINMLMKGVSAVRYSTINHLRLMLNNNMIPIVNEYGGVGASGDLIHNQRIVSAARGIDGTMVYLQTEKISASEALKKLNILPLQLDPKEGLGLVNGDNFSTAYAAISAYKLSNYFLLSLVIAAVTIEVLKGSDRSFHPLLAHVRNHAGQKETANIYRFLLSGSKLAYNEMQGHQLRPQGVKVQDAYSIRCLSQFDGVYLEQLKNALECITINANSASDNPLWVPPEITTENETPWQWVSGGNFLAMHMVETLDSMRKLTTQLIKQLDRHLAKLIDPNDNNGLTANLSDAQHAITNCTFKGVQIQMGMYEIYSMHLANPISTLFGTHEERNQDFTSHATTSGSLTLKNLDILKYALSSMLLAVAQGVDLRGGPNMLSPHTKPLYEYIRTLVDFAPTEKPLHNDITKISNSIDDGSIFRFIIENIFNNYND